jgi:hypothetical protein
VQHNTIERTQIWRFADFNPNVVMFARYSVQRWSVTKLFVHQLLYLKLRDATVVSEEAYYLFRGRVQLR